MSGFDMLYVSTTNPASGSNETMAPSQQYSQGAAPDQSTANRHVRSLWEPRSKVLSRTMVMVLGQAKTGARHDQVPVRDTTDPMLSMAAGRLSQRPPTQDIAPDIALAFAGVSIGLPESGDCLPGVSDVRLRHLSIRNFRAIKELEWSPGSELCCLIGPGDGCKTTILDAIEYALYPTWPLNVSDADFPDCEPTDDIVIEATVSPVSSALKKHESLHGSFRQWRNGEIQDEPDGSGELALTVRLRIDASLEPEWTVVTEREANEEIPLRTRARTELGLVRLTGNPDPHLSWRRGSYLTRLAPSDTDATQILTDIHRDARSSITEDTFSDLTGVIEAIQIAARKYGVGPAGEGLGIRMDPTRSNFGMSLLSLHSREIPTTRSGLGTRRLLAAAIQATSVPDGATMLIDEIETGLEPHRIKGLLQLLRRSTAAATTSSGQLVEGVDESSDPNLDREPLGQLDQVILTSHSPAVICELEASNLHVVRREPDGLVDIRRVADDLQGLVRRQPEALLGRRVVLCEGATEIGVIRGMESFWAAIYGDGTPFSHIGVALANGEGSRISEYALGLSALQYPTILFVDGDTEMRPSVETLQDAGVTLVRWSDGLCTEQRVALDLPLDALQELISYAEDVRGEQAVRDSIAFQLRSTGQFSESLSDAPIWTWIDTVGEAALRSAFGAVAAKSTDSRPGWFKRIDHGEWLGKLIVEYWDALEGSELCHNLDALGKWAYGDDP